MMKLTREQVSQLSDDGLNLRLFKWQFGFTDVDMNRRFKAGKINYLTDYSLTMPLAYKHDIFSGPFNQDNLWFAHDNKCQGFSAYNINPLRAICEVLLMIAMEREA